jgi:hypothetical protein
MFVLHMRREFAILLALALVCTRPPAAYAQDEAPSRSVAALSKEFSDPLTTLPQVSLQNIYTPRNFGTEADTNRLVLRPLIPRVPRFRLLPFPQLIRPTLSLVTVPTGRGGNTRTEFGDIQLFDFALLPWPRTETGLLIGVGPTLNFPTASDKNAGVGAWQAGPAFGMIYKGIPGLLLGCLVQNPISLSYTRSNHPPFSTLLFQPLALAYVGHGFYVKSADSTWTNSWGDDKSTTIPLSFGIGYVWLREASPPVNLFVSGEWMAYRQDARVAPQTSVRFGITMAFPNWRPWS